MPARLLIQALDRRASVEQIGKAVVVKTKQFARPIIRMVEAKKLKTKG